MNSGSSQCVLVRGQVTLPLQTVAFSLRNGDGDKICSWDVVGLTGGDTSKSPRRGAQHREALRLVALVITVTGTPAGETAVLDCFSGAHTEMCIGSQEG